MRSITLVSAILLSSAVAHAITSDGNCPADTVAPALESVAATVNDAVALTSAPSPERFADAWSSAFADAVRAAAGTDGRLSKSEASALAASGSLYGDNAVDWLAASGQKSVSVDKLIRDEKAIALAAGKSVAGADGRISLADGAKLPANLKADFFALRGKTAPAPASDFAADVAAATKGMDMMSESDANLAFISGASSETGAITADEIKSVLGASADAMMRDGTVWMNGPDASYAGLDARFPETRDANDFFAQYSQPSDPGDPASVAAAAQFQKLGDLLKANLTDLTVIRFDEQKPPSDAITATTFIVGRTADGTIAGVITAVVET